MRPFAIFLTLIHGMIRTIADLRNIHIKTISYFILLHLPQKHPLFLAILGNQVIEVRSQKAHVLGIRWILLTLTFTKQSILVSTDSSEVDFQRAGKYLCWLQVIVNIVLAIAKTTLWQFFSTPAHTRDVLHQIQVAVKDLRTENQSYARIRG